jgi:hypothetical protein
VSHNYPASFAVATNSAVADVIASTGFTWVPAVVLVSAVTGITAAVVVITAVDGSGDVAKVSAVAAVPTAVDLISAAGVSNVSGIPLCLPSLLFMLFLPVLATLLLASPEVPFTAVSPTVYVVLLLSAFLDFLLWRPYCC